MSVNPLGGLWSDSIAQVLTNNNLHVASGDLLKNKNAYMYTQAHVSFPAHAQKPPCSRTGTISASSLFHFGLWSSHFPPVSDPLALSHFNPSPVPPRPDRGVSTQRKRESCKEGVVPFG